MSNLDGKKKTTGILMKIIGNRALSSMSSIAGLSLIMMAGVKVGEILVGLLHKNYDKD